MSGQAPSALERVAALEIPALVERYVAGSGAFDRRVLDLDDEQLDTWFKPGSPLGRWSCRALLGHVADADVVLAHRARRAAAEAHPVLHLWDEDAFLDAGLYAASPPAGHVAMLHTTRLWMADWLRSLGVESWARPALHPESGEVTVRGIIGYATWHAEHHGAFLRRKLDALLGAGPANGA